MGQLKKVYSNEANFIGSMRYNMERGLDEVSFREALKEAGYDLLLRKGSDYRIGDLIAVIGRDAATITIYKVNDVTWKDEEKTEVDFFTVKVVEVVNFLE